MSTFNSPIQPLLLDDLAPYEISIWIKRDDLLHAVVSGNKFRKLKYNLLDIAEKSTDTIVTFGGAFSNHIVATAYLAQQQQLRSVGIIRGEAPPQLNHTLRDAQQYGMELRFISRSAYAKKSESDFLSELEAVYPHATFIPEGGANELGVKGCEEIVTECQESTDFDYISVDCGTGATLAGMIRCLQPHQKAIGVQVLKGSDFISEEVGRLNHHLGNTGTFEIWTDYHFGGYAKKNDDLVQFMRWFYERSGIQLDPIYTGKQVYAIIDQIKKGYFPKGSKIIITHTGGLQGIEGYEQRYQTKIY